MPATRSLRRLSPATFQVIIDGFIAAILRQVSPTSIEIWIERTEPFLLITLTDLTKLTTNPVGIAKRLAEGEFDDDFRFAIYPWEEPEMDATHTVVHISTPSQIVIDTFTTNDPYGAVEAAREAQATPDLEERWAMYAERGW